MRKSLKCKTLFVELLNPDAPFYKYRGWIVGNLGREKRVVVEGALSQVQEYAKERKLETCYV